MSQHLRSRSLTRRSVVASGTAAGALSLMGGHPTFAQDASPAATAPISKVAERAKGEVRLTNGENADGQAIVQAMLKGFAAKYPNITVKYEAIPADYSTKILTDIAAGTVADVFTVQNEVAQDFMSRYVLAPIDDYMAEDGVTADMYYPALVKAYSWQGKTYGLPKDWSPIGAVYDPDVFSTAGIEMPTTWDGLRDALQKLKDSTGTPQLALDAQFSRFVIFLYQAGGNITNQDVTAITLYSPEATQALEYYYGLYKDGLSSTSADLGAGVAGRCLRPGNDVTGDGGKLAVPVPENQCPGTRSSRWRNCRKVRRARHPRIYPGLHDFQG